MRSAWTLSLLCVQVSYDLRKQAKLAFPRFFYVFSDPMKTAQTPAIITVPEGKIRDYIDGKFRVDTPE